MQRGRRYSVSSDRDVPLNTAPPPFRFPGTSEDLHAWSIYRQVRAHISRLSCFLFSYFRTSTVILLTQLWVVKTRVHCPMETSS